MVHGRAELHDASCKQARPSTSQRHLHSLEKSLAVKRQFQAGFETRHDALVLGLNLRSCRRPQKKFNRANTHKQNSIVRKLIFSFPEEPSSSSTSPTPPVVFIRQQRSGSHTDSTKKIGPWRISLESPCTLYLAGERHPAWTYLFRSTRERCQFFSFQRWTESRHPSTRNRNRGRHRIAIGLPSFPGVGL